MSNWLDLSNVSNILRQSYINGFLDASGPIIGRNDVSFNQKLFVAQDASFNSRLFVGNDASFDNNIYVKNYVYSATPVASDNSQKLATTAFVQDKLSVIANNGSFVGDVTMFNRLFVYQDVSLSGNFYALGNTILAGDVSMNTRLYVQNDTSLNANLFVKGDVSFNKSVLIGGDVSLNSRVFIGGDLSVNGNVNINGNITVPTPISSDNSQKVATTAYVKSALSALSGSSASFAGDVSINNRLFVGSDASFGGRLFTGGDVSFNGKLNVGGGSSFFSSPLIVGFSSITSNSASNIAIGPNANCGTGDYNTSLGWNAGGSASNTGNNNVALGDYTLSTITSGYQNVAVGNGCMQGAITTGYKNTGVGHTALYNLSTGYNNTAIGHGAGFSTGSFNSSTAIGYNSAITANNQITLGTSTEHVNCPGDISANSRLFVNGDTSLNGNVYIAKDLLINGHLSVRQYNVQQVITTISYELLIAQDLSINGRLFLVNDASFLGRLFVVGDVSLNGNVYAKTQTTGDNTNRVATTAFVANAVSAISGASASFAGDVSINNRLFVGADASLGGNLSVANVLKPTIISEPFTTTNASSSSYTFNYAQGSIFYITTPPSSNFNVNLTNVPTDISRTYLATFILSSTVNKTFCSSIQINGNTAIIPNFANGIPLASQLGSMNTQSVIIQRVSAGDASANMNVFSSVTPYLTSTSNSMFVNNTDASFGSRVFIGGNLSVSGNITGTYPSGSIPSSAIIGGVATSNFTTDVSINQRLIVLGDTSMNSRLFVGSDASMGGNLAITKNISVNGIVFQF